MRLARDGPSSPARKRRMRRTAHAGPRLGAGEHVEQEREVADSARHRAVGRNLVEEQIADSASRANAAEARAETVDVAEGGRIAQRPHRVGAVGERHQPCRQRRRRAAARTAGRPRQVVGIAGDAVHRVEAVRAEAEFRRVGLADQDRAGSADARGEQVVASPERGRRRAASRGSCGCLPSRRDP